MNKIDYSLAQMKLAGLKPRLCDRKSGHIKVGDWNYWVKRETVYGPGMRKGERGAGLQEFIRRAKSPVTRYKPRKHGPLKKSAIWRCPCGHKTDIKQYKPVCKCGKPIPKPPSKCTQS